MSATGYAYELETRRVVARIKADTRDDVRNEFNYTFNPMKYGLEFKPRFKDEDGLFNAPNVKVIDNRSSYDYEYDEEGRLDEWTPCEDNY